MKTITIDNELYAFIASQTKHIGESASDILRRLLIDNTEYGDIHRSNNTSAAPETATRLQNTPAGEPQTSQSTSTTKSSANIADLLTRLPTSENTSRVELFLMILSAMYVDEPARFKQVLNVKGRNRLYFGTSKEQLLESGSSTNPKQIPESEYWVVTNNNTAKKQAMLSEVAIVLGYDEGMQEQVIAAFA